jgi:hypothetical protein
MAEKVAWKIPSFRDGLIIATVIAIVSFMFIHRYNPVRGPLANIMNAEIFITDACPPVDLFAQPSETRPEGCSQKIPYRWVFAGLVLFVAFCWYGERKS